VMGSVKRSRDSAETGDRPLDGRSITVSAAFNWIYP
jgi:hypothetical protein